jgi:AraC-like DNA-binding protein
MRQRLDEPLSVRAMARIAYVSPYYFNRTFRRLTGIPPCQFHYALRLEEARRLVLTTARDIVDICYEVGYNSLGTFTRRFTALLGTSPLRLRSLASSPQGAAVPKAACERALRSGFEPGPSVDGCVTAPAGFCGLIFVGLFADAIPQGKPAACAILHSPGPYRIASAPDGIFHLFAVGLPASASPKEYFHYDSALRAGGGVVWVRGGRADTLPGLELQAPSALDPPILTGLPLLLQLATAPPSPSPAVFSAGA